MAELAPVLYIDAYDSFANNIIALLSQETGRQIVKTSIHHPVQDLAEFVRPFAAVVVGPGPGTVTNPADVGITNELWKLPAESTVPVLGICLGFQSLVLHHGGSIECLPHPRHGIERLITSRGQSIFRNIESFTAVQYHSLHACLGHVLPRGFEKSLSESIFEPTTSAPQLIPLAWDIAEKNSPGQELPHADDSSASELAAENPRFILMAVKHTTKPFYGLQFHPESICSSTRTRQIITNWWDEAQAWSRLEKAYAIAPYLKGGAPSIERGNRPVAEPLAVNQEVFPTEERQAQYPRSNPTLLSNTPVDDYSIPAVYQKQIFPVGTLDVPKIVSSLSLIDQDQEAVILDSARPTIGLGSKSIIGCIDAATLHVTYTVDTQVARLRRGRDQWTENLAAFGGSIFEFLKSFLRQCRLDASNEHENKTVFSGGLIGYIDYEACLETLAVKRPATPSGRPNLHFAFVERSIVLDHETGTVTVQSIKTNDQQWIVETSRRLSPESGPSLPQDGGISSESQSETDSLDQAGDSRRASRSVSPLSSFTCSDTAGDELEDSGAAKIDEKRTSRLEVSNPSLLSNIRIPREESYKAKIRQCQEELRAGNSYELCLTDQTKILTRSPDLRAKSPWKAYCQLRCMNPAPFAAYMRLGPLTLMSSSPERFMSWTRPSAEAPQDVQTDQGQATTQQWLTSTCQFRPIKGTVKKHVTEPDGSKRMVTLDEATKILSTQKERAENLMIVDLIRHDLYGVAGPGNVDVPQLMRIEEYEHVYQLVSVIQGRLYEPAPNASSGYAQPSHNYSREKSGPHHDADSSHTQRKCTTGIDVLANSLPPGSMTGAPKRRSCELLTGIEGNSPRSIYSGVLGYLDVGGGGDFSVVIRTLFRWDDERNAEDGFDTWRVGAGGAITVLSTQEGEWEEMNAKLSSVLGLFDV